MRRLRQPQRLGSLAHPRPPADRLAGGDLVLVDGGDGAGRPVAGGASLLQNGVQFVLKVGVAELWLFKVDVGEAEGGSGAQAGGGQGPST